MGNGKWKPADHSRLPIEAMSSPPLDNVAPKEIGRPLTGTLMLAILWAIFHFPVPGGRCIEKSHAL